MSLLENVIGVLSKNVTIMSESEIDYKMAKWDSALIGWLIDWFNFLTILLKVIFSSQKIDLSGRPSPSTCRAYNNNSTVGLKKKN